MCKVLDFENVNGFRISLKVESRNLSPISQRYTISFKNKERHSSWPLKSLLLAVLFNIIGFSYVRISLTTTLVIFIVIAFLIFFWVTHTVQEESVLVIPTVCVQSSVKFVVGREDNYIPWSNIDDVIINEVVQMNRVLYFLTILVKTNETEGNPKLMPMFKYTKPRLMMLQVIYNQIQALLLESRNELTELGSGDRQY
ncbi:phosphatidylinositol N-acetylglucosaminyltransferase subunit H-like [Zerene cesonia]|uniref:phosphatidylinositol N-acetylglucosaminyltransferase subunit H-like n=1 Tax=Zerene cesonia TaxID=33412 RepID=UPI0018E57337|nr:phosphatidylinositol N-acetylglucosaminyltransferase subunit H-like [Zerene cesonia]